MPGGVPEARAASSRVCLPVNPSADRGEEVGGLSVPRAELNSQPQLSLYIPDGG